MIVQFFVLAVACLLLTVRTEDGCENWKSHKNFHLLYSEDDCGMVKDKNIIVPRILNGKDARRGSIPWIALVVIQEGTEQYICGGSIINQNYILTAAHCFNLSRNPTTTVELGVENIKNVNDTLIKKHKVKEYHVHPFYDRRSNKNDIALLRLDTSISFQSSYINYVCLPNSCAQAEKSTFGRNLKIAGWGFLSLDVSASTLQTVSVPLRQCKNYTLNGKSFSPARSQLCARSYRTMACVGDSGGPLVYKNPTGRAVQVGVLSFGPSDCTNSSQDQIDKYSRVTSFMNWILDTIKK